MEENGGKVRALIEMATNSTAPHVDERLLKAIKHLVRYSSLELCLAAETLMDLMKRHHSQVRYLTLLIIDELFMRSKLFRVIVVENLDQLLSLSIGFRRNLPLPGPAAVASLLRSKAIEFLEKWNTSFGVHYRQIRLGFEYLKNTLQYQFPNLHENAARVQQERREREMRSKEILGKKFEALRENLSSMKEEIQSTVDEIMECLDIVSAKEENLMVCPLDSDDDDDDECFGEFRSSELRQLRLDSLKEGEKVHENTENKVVFDALREQYKLLATKHMVSVQECISILIRVEVEDNKLRDSMLKDFIDIKNHLQSVKKQCVESGCILPDIVKGDKDEGGEDFWEEGKVGSTATENSTQKTEAGENVTVASTSGVVQDGSPESGNKSQFNKSVEYELEGTDSNSLRGKLLAEAPAIEWGSFLNNWGSKSDVLANQRGMEFENHWGRVDYDAVIPADKVAKLNIRATIYKEKQMEIQPCLTPLHKGGLCQRRDLRVCPFHGPIIPRDDEGNPFNQDTSTNESALRLSIDLGNQLAKEAVKNVRDRDAEEARKRKMDKQLQKRAKLARVREHNEAVLKDAALASTSKSATLGEDLESPSREKSARNKKETLASTLRKKVTRKDRLSQRVLNTRASDATVRQLTLGEDANYREAFPNQW